MEKNDSWIPIRWRYIENFVVRDLKLM